MAEVKALFPIGKTQWRKWRPEQQIAFNEARADGVPFADAVAVVNQMEAPKKKSFFDIIGDAVEDVGEVAETVAGVAATVAPVIGTAKTVARVAGAIKPKKGK